MFQTVPLLFSILLISSWIRWRWKVSAQRSSEDAFAVQQGCRPIRRIFSGKLPLGLDLAQGLLRANAGHHLLAFLQGFINDLGPDLELRILGNVGLVTVDPENVKSVLSKSKFREGELDFVYGERRDALLPLFGEGLFTQDGIPWKHSREMLRKQFARIQYHNLDIFTEHVELLVRRVSSSEDNVIDLQPLFFNFTLDTTTSLLFGHSAGSLREHSKDELGGSLNDASWISAIRVQLAYLYWLCSPPRYTKACSNVKEYADNWVKKALDRQKDIDDTSGQYAFIKSLYSELKDPRLVRDQLVNVLLAGRDTTACLLSWTFRLLVRHEVCLDRLRGEVESVLGSSQSVSKAQLQQMTYLKQVITETLRLYPSVPINFREANHPTVIPHGGGPDGASPVLVRKNMGIGYAPYYMHRRKDLYGEDAFSFKPERWEDGSLQERIGWGYLPFNGGPRICLGRKDIALLYLQPAANLAIGAEEFAILEASYAVARIIQSFPNLGLPADEEVVPVGAERQRVTLTLSPADGCRVRLR